MLHSESFWNLWSHWNFSNNFFKIFFSISKHFFLNVENFATLTTNTEIASQCPTRDRRPKSTDYVRTARTVGPAEDRLVGIWGNFPCVPFQTAFISHQSWFHTAWCPSNFKSKLWVIFLLLFWVQVWVQLYNVVGNDSRMNRTRLGRFSLES